MSDEQPVLECQECGDVIRKLSHEEAQDMAYRPYAWVAYCWQCGRGGV